MHADFFRLLFLLKHCFLSLVFNLKTQKFTYFFFLFKQLFEFFRLWWDVYSTLSLCEPSYATKACSIIWRYSWWRESEGGQKLFYHCYFRVNYQPLLGIRHHFLVYIKYFCFLCVRKWKPKQNKKWQIVCDLPQRWILY